MGLFSRLLGGVKEQYIARPQEASHELVYRHPNQNIPRGAKLTVRSDERVLFFQHGKLIGTLSAGEHTIASGVIPFLDALVVRPLTGGDHFVTELFFVRETEHIHHVVGRDLGTFNDIASRHVVTVCFSARFAVRVTDPAALITTLGGQWEGASNRIGEFLDARIRSLLSAVVGRMLSTMPVLQIVSSQHNEAVGQHVQQLAAPEFRLNGLELVRFLDLELQLDKGSADALRDFGNAQAELSIQREGASIAGQPGFANYHLVQGQRAALEGLGQGLATGRMGPVLGFGGVGMMPPALGMPPATGGFIPRPANTLPMQTSTLDVTAPRLPGPLETSWHLRTERGSEGPFTASQLANRLATEPGDAGDQLVQAAGRGAWVAVRDLPALAEYLAKRVQSPSTPPALRPQGFEAAVRDLGSPRTLTTSEFDALVLALAREQADADMPALREQARLRLAARGFAAPAEALPG